MYVSKFFTCEEIDQRLKQGYYDDFVSAGFVGSLQEFLAFVLSLKDKPDTKSVNELLAELEKKLQESIQAVQDKSDKDDKELEAKLEAQKVTKVSQLENDSKYQTEEEVKAYISALVNGADESLDTLLELAQALGNDPNFAATITEKLGQLKKAIEDETARAKEEEQELKEALATEIGKREDGDKAIIEIAEGHYNNLDAKISAIQQTIVTLQQNYLEFTENVNQKVEEAKEEAKSDNESLKSELEGQIQAEAERATTAEGEISGKIEELAKKHTDDLTGITDSIDANTQAIKREASDRKEADLGLQQKILEEASSRSDMDAQLLDKIGQETLARIEGDTDLQTKLATETADRKDADVEIRASIAEEKNSREAADLALEKGLDKLELKHDTELATVSDGLAQEIARATAAEEGKVDKVAGKGLSTNDFTNALLDKLNGIQEQANYITKVSELLNDSGFQTEEQVKAEIQKIIGSAPDVLDTLQEIAEALDNDPNFAGTMLNRLASITTDLNKEVEDRKTADDTLRLELLAKVKEATDGLSASYQVLEERLNTYKTLADSQNTTTNARIDTLDDKVDSKVEYFLEKVTDLSDKYSEKVTELNTKVNQFTSDILARVSAQDDLINGNAANIARNLELIQGMNAQLGELKDTDNKNLNQLLQAIRDEADARKLADDALKDKLAVTDGKIDDTNKALEELEQYVKDNPSNVAGSSTIDAKVRTNEEGKTETVVSVIIDEDEQVLTKGSRGLRTKLNFKKTQSENGLTYELTGADGTPVDGVEKIEVPEATPFTEDESHAMYVEIYGDAFDPETAQNLIGMTENEATQIFNGVYNS